MELTFGKNHQAICFFDYAINEALFLSEKEEAIITNIFENIRQEYHTNIDKFSQDLIIAQVELLLKYCDRFYNRQFLTRKISNSQMLSKVEDILNDYFNEKILRIGVCLPFTRWLIGCMSPLIT